MSVDPLNSRFRCLRPGETMVGGRAHPGESSRSHLPFSDDDAYLSVEEAKYQRHKDALTSHTVERN